MVSLYIGITIMAVVILYQQWCIHKLDAYIDHMAEQYNRFVDNTEENGAIFKECILVLAQDVDELKEDKDNA